MSVTCAPSPCGPALPVARLAGRYSCDYYGHSVAIGLASLRRSHVQQRYTSERDLGVPFASFNALTGHRSCAPEDYGMLLQFRRRDRRRLQASFRRGTSYPFWRLGFRQSSFRHITRISRRAAPYAWARPPVSWHAIVPFTFRVLGQPLDPETSPLISARCAGDITLRLVAQQHGSTATHPDAGGLAGTREDGELHRYTQVDVLPPDGMQEVRSSNLLSSTQIRDVFRTDDQPSLEAYSSKIQQ